MNQRLYRSTSEQMLGGVAAGIAHRLGVDPTLVRIGFVLGTFLTHGALFLLYLALWAVLPSSASTAATVSDVVRENMNEAAARVGFHPAPHSETGTAAASTAAPSAPSVRSALGHGPTLARVLVIGGLIWALAMMSGMGAMFSGHHVHGGGGFIFPLMLLLGAFWFLRRRRA